MRRTSFDKRLIQILSAMAALAVIVGVVAIGVNRYLVRAHAELVQTNLPAIELASEIGASAEVVGSLAQAFVQADTREALDRAAGALSAAVAEIEARADAFVTLRMSEVGARRRSGAQEIVARMTLASREDLELEARIASRADKIAGIGTQLDALVEAETDLARLRITAGVADLYVAPDVAPRPALDALADRYFFAFERLTELARMVDALRLQFQQVPSLTRQADVEAMQVQAGAQLDLALRRVVYMPSPLAAEEAAAQFSRLQAALGDGALLDLQGRRIALQAAIGADRQLLQATVADLSERARQMRSAMQATSLDRIALVDRQSAWILLVLLGLVGAAVVLGAVLVWYARRQLVDRLGTVSRRIVAVAGGDYGAPLPISGHDEIGRMEKALNILRRRARDAERLRDSLEEAVIARTGEVVGEMQAADAARAEAEQANRSKTEFLARMSHEIRTPLNGMIGMLDLLEAETESPERKERAHTALCSARELLDLTNDILSFASGEDTTARGTSLHFHLRELVGQMGHQLQSLAAPKGLETSVDLSEAAPLTLYGDVVKIRQVVGNLISNAVKYTRRGSITLAVDYAVDTQTDQPVLSFSVIDTGIGMTQEAIGHAFDAYQRADSAKRAGIEGLGLGLAISRTLTRALGGALTVESEVGVGSRFTLTVPLMPGDPELVGDADTLVHGAELDRDVLVIDDHAVNLIVARGYLERLGCRVTDAETGTAGLKAVSEQAFDLVLIDLDLPDMTGRDVAARIAAMADPPMLVALTAHLIADTPENRAELGVARILSKPISPRALAEVLRGEEGGDAPARDDADVVESLQGDLNDLGSETTAQIVREFLDDLPGAIATIDDARAEDRRKAAHKLKGAASNFRLHAFCAALAQLEQAEGPATADVQAVRETAREAEQALRDAAAKLGLQTVSGSTK
ncbi:ATP-binding protein [Marivita sp. S6314]|uniref:ATP-binding protein n=1 Tax=Marivita sp. S6314 TaxID=2926406 RepID=UPI001FF57EBE|nr:ATP-binding protein [Marivita sp. S6314]MCK0151592.1 ATP-binding protein [Marivita sp. S6314]